MALQGDVTAVAAPNEVLVSGASFAGLSTAFWMNKLGFKVTVVEVAKDLKKGGTPVNIGDDVIDIVRRMGLFEKIQASRLHMKKPEVKTADDHPAEPLTLAERDGPSEYDWEIERDTLLQMVFDAIKADVEFIFDDSVEVLGETSDRIDVTFKSGARRPYSVLFGCDGHHSAVRRLQFGKEDRYSHFLGNYFSITIVDKLLIKENTTQMHSAPGNFMMLNAYNDKTDICFGFASESEIAYDYRNEQQQRDIIYDRFAGQGWRAAELVEEIKNSRSFYFDKMCQIKMPSWTKGRVALVGDAAYCASPAAGMGGSLAIIGAAQLPRPILSGFRR